MTYEVVGDARVPWVYSDFEDEYQALRSKAALFDHSSVATFSVAGDGAPAFLQQVLARDVEYLSEEQCMSSLVLDEGGRLVDSVVVYALEGSYLVETSFGSGARTWQHLRATAGDGVELTDLRGAWGVVGIEGPYSWEVVGQIFEPELTALPFQTLLQTDWRGQPVHVARAGFTAEYGYKVIGPRPALSPLWDRVAEHVPPVGQAVLESVMTEVRQPIVHRELGRNENVVEAGLNWLVDRNKDAFLGKEAVESMWQDGPRSRRVGARSTVAVETGATVLAGDRRIGEVVMSAPSPGLAGHVVLLQVDPSLAAAGLELQVPTATDTVPVTTLSSPYVVPASWGVPIF